MRSGTKTSSSRRSALPGAILAVVTTALAVIILTQHVLIVDTIKSMQFTPADGIVTIHDNVTLTGAGTRIFYASGPQLVEDSSFNDDCHSTEKTSVVLGCYANGMIYLYDINNIELHGIKEVTAAHEMLHAAYDRLSGLDKKAVDRLLEKEVQALRSNNEFESRMSVYDELSDADKINELHSVIGTEVASLDPELEAYYSRYFKDRSQVVNYYAQYHSVFAQLESQADSLAMSLDEQAASINMRIAKYNEAATQLDADIRSFNQRATDGFYTTQAQFNADRSALVSQANALDGEKDSINSAIARYNADKSTYDGLASHLSELNNSIDSTLAPAPTVSE